MGGVTDSYPPDLCIESKIRAWLKDESWAAFRRGESSPFTIWARQYPECPGTGQLGPVTMHEGCGCVHAHVGGFRFIPGCESLVDAYALWRSSLRVTPTPAVSAPVPEPPDAVRAARCEHCGVLFQARRSTARFCTPAHCTAHWRATHHPTPTRERACVECGQLYTYQRSTSRFCSPRCLMRSRRRLLS